MKIDMHVHTSRHSSCAVMSPQQMAEAALQSGLDGVTLAEHDYLWTAEEARELAEQFPPLAVFRAIEVSTDEGHFLAYGACDSDLYYPQMSLAELVRRVHGAGGIVVMAHPGRYGDDVPDGVFALPVDGLEVASGSIRAHAKPVIEGIGSRIDLPGIAGSDGHDTWEMGLYATDFADRIVDEGQLAAAVKQRQFSVYRNRARLDQLNGELLRKNSLVADLRAKGMSADEICERYDVPHEILRNVTEGKDVRFV